MSKQHKVILQHNLVCKVILDGFTSSALLFRHTDMPSSNITKNVSASETLYLLLLLPGILPHRTAELLLTCSWCLLRCPISHQDFLTTSYCQHCWPPYPVNFSSWHTSPSDIQYIVYLVSFSHPIEYEIHETQHCPSMARSSPSINIEKQCHF